MTNTLAKDIAEERDELEKMIDRYGIADVLGFISEVCAGKAEHLRVNWQDNAQAKQWEAVGRAVDKAADKAVSVF